MNFREENGFTGVDISIAVILILIFIPTIFGVIYNIRSAKGRTEREASSISQAIEILEESKGNGIENVETYLKSKYGNNAETVGTGGFIATTVKNEVSYKIEVSYQYPSKYVESDPDTHFVKKVIVKVTYPTGNTTKTIEMSTILKKEIV